MNTSRTIGLLLALAAGAAGCDSDADAGTDAGTDAGALPAPGAGSDGGAALVAAEMCAPACSTEDFPAGSPSSLGFDPAHTCHDGCNYFVCTEDGPVMATARACSDAGVP